MTAADPHSHSTPGETRLKRFGLGGGPLLALASALFTGALAGEQRVVVATTVLLAVWWMTEAVPLAVSALVGCILLSVFGAVPLAELAALAGNSLIWLFIGGMLIARGMEASGLHRRIALRVLRLAGGGPRGLVLGLMVAGAVLSMFVSNSATALMLFPIARSLVEGAVPEGEQRRLVGAAAMLGLAYGCNAGGAASLIGTPPNLILVEAYELQHPAAPPIGFWEWLLVGVPLLLCLLPLAWLYLTRIAFRLPAAAELPIRGSAPHAALPPWSAAERRVAWVFGLAALAWVTRGVWGPWVPWRGSVCDAGVACLAALTLFARVPQRAPATAGTETPETVPILTIADCAHIPWSLIALIARGLLLSAGYETSGLTAVAGEALAGWGGTDPAWIVGGVACAAVVLSAFTSNTGSAAILAPVLMAAAPALGLDPRLLLFAAAMGVSCDFMLPVGTPPNAIVFGSGWLTVGRMARVGLVMDLAAMVIVALVVRFAAVPLLGIPLP